MPRPARGSLIPQVCFLCVLGSPERPAPGGTVLFPAPHPSRWVNYLLHTNSSSSPSIPSTVCFYCLWGVGEFSSWAPTRLRAPGKGRGMLVIQSAGSTYSPRGSKPGLGIPLEPGPLARQHGLPASRCPASGHPPAPLPQGIWLLKCRCSRHRGKQPISPSPQLFPLPLSPPWSIGQKKKSMKVGLGRGIEMRNRLSPL